MTPRQGGDRQLFPACPCFTGFARHHRDEHAGWYVVHSKGLTGRWTISENSLGSEGPPSSGGKRAPLAWTPGSPDANVIDNAAMTSDTRHGPKERTGRTVRQTQKYSWIQNAFGKPNAEYCGEIPAGRLCTAKFTISNSRYKAMRRTPCVCWRRLSKRSMQAIRQRLFMPRRLPD